MNLGFRGIPDQVVRLAILFGAAAAFFFAVRTQFVPETFGEIGHYRASALDDLAAKEIRHAGWQACVECHEEQGAARSASFHRTVTCEVCHGAAAAHAADPEAARPHVPRKRGEACLNCHAYLSARPTGFPQIIEANHNPGEPCIGCHDPHAPNPPSAPESCEACHAQITRTKSLSRHRDLTCETCHEAPAEHRENPRSHLPKKPVERAFCGQCHARDAKGAAAAPRVDIGRHGGSYLCWQCHYPHDPES